ncbi:MAG: endonuclease [Flavobacteriales bacterium]|nr:endonuclease [Flavobacteriia bacterium]NCP05347.1 endonuclease [Flavobacteriales bacterium]PIV93910.1 MAG: endonuclease [Flavobacteriaceae bacterium CG17_big_fil_post_rev_8_21_14_2_50_33_15]PIY13511.1 MAG: endonuclease [Flavobacteriaceae bacterium CG_4_10_14_3_um_filter_33_47]PJB18938.1 MAG: endonuclease [Flavobacteriaceae bacterium CG_4_9_14_3_um_filter_33_16]
MNDLFEDNFSIHYKHTIAFYNLENLFDIHDDHQTNDNDLLPTSVKKWTYKRYENKLRKIGFAISSIGFKETDKHPAIIGLAEVENDAVLKDLIASKHLSHCNYRFVHFDSMDERGIDVALLYDSTYFRVSYSETFSVELTNDEGLPDYTRDILLVTGFLEEEEIHVIVNHWSSRREGANETGFKRLAASNKVIEVIETLKLKNKHAKIIVIGDFNDDPNNDSIQRLIKNQDLFNPMESLLSFSRGSTSHDFKWNLFDQIMFTKNFFETEPNTFSYLEANIFDDDFLKLFSGKYKGKPFRTYVGKKYKGGYSDHFPVYAIFKKND